MKKSVSVINRTFIWTGIFSIAMGVLEAIVVVYLRQVYYPDGFYFPLQFITPEMMYVEWTRETATVIMLAALGIIAGRDNLNRFLYFLFSFAIWDLVYYAALKIFLDWPASLLTWDILFLIPVPWISPVLAPVICSAAMIVMSVTFMYKREMHRGFKIRTTEWILTLTGAALILLSFVEDFLMLIIQSDFDTKANSGFWETAARFVPVTFNWWLFGAGMVLILTSITATVYHFRKKNNQTFKKIAAN